MTTSSRDRNLKWDIYTPQLVKLREKGATYNDLVDYLKDEHGVVVAGQTIRLRIKDLVAEDVVKGGEKTEPVKNENLVKEAIYRYLLLHPAGSIVEIAEATGHTVDTVVALHETVKSENPGYTIIPPRHRRETYSETEMLDALVDASETIGGGSGNPLSQAKYANWRGYLPPTDKVLFPSPLAFRRRYGSWGEAVEAAGLPRNERPREYDGISKDDAVLWLAYFLRHLKESAGYMVEATSSEYRQWIRNIPEAPSEELLRIKGVWGYMLVDAAEIERTVTYLPPLKPVWSGGRQKKERGAFSNN
jgi:hypothetical protein